jgi:hypothetical protein
MGKLLVPNTGKIAMAMISAMSLQGIDRTNALADLTSRVRPSPKPNKPTGIAKARRQARKRRNILSWRRGRGHDPG